MARIRMLKPEFFIDSKLGRKSAFARLLFLGLWGHADREGRLEEDIDVLKIQILPYDDVDIKGLLDELLGGQVVGYEVSGRRYLQIRNFVKHQRPHTKEPASTLPAPTVEDMGKATEKHGEPCKKEAKTQTNSKVRCKVKSKVRCKITDSNEPSLTDFQNLWNKYAETSRIVKCRELNDERKAKCRLRLAERPLHEWEEVFSKCAKTPFLNGAGNTGWRASFDWIIVNSTNALKVLEGKYDDASQSKSEYREYVDRKKTAPEPIPVDVAAIIAKAGAGH